MCVQVGSSRAGCRTCAGLATCAGPQECGKRSACLLSVSVNQNKQQGRKRTWAEDMIHRPMAAAGLSQEVNKIFAW
jgi:hypothetical protein